MDFVTELRYTTNLDSGVQMTPLKNSFLSGDQDAHRFTVSCFRSTSRQPVDLTGAGVTGYFIRADQSTVVIDGKVEDNCAVLTLPAACYAKEGRFSLVIKASMSGVIHTILWAEGAVSQSHTGAIIDPGEVVPTLDELLAQIAAMEIATSNANTAAENANQAAADATSTANAAAASAQATANAAATQAVEIATAKGDEAVQVATEQVEAQNQAIAKIATDLLTKAPAIECEASGSLVTVTDAAAQPAVQLVTHIEPVQEGEGAPRPANKNLWSYGEVALNNSETTITFDRPLPAGDYTLSLVMTADVVDGIIWVEVDKDGDAFAANASGVRNSLTISSDGTKDSIYFRSANDIVLEQIQLERGTEATDYVAHDPGNVRPIRGWDKVTALRACKSLVPSGFIAQKSITSNGITFAGLENGWVSVQGVTTGVYPQTTSTSHIYPFITLQPGKYRLIQFADGENIGSARWLANNYKGSNFNSIFELTEPTNMRFFPVVDTQEIGMVIDCKIAFMLIADGDEIPTAYEPYQGQTLTADLPETVYGGTLDWGAGELAVDVACINPLNLNISKNNSANTDYLYYVSISKSYTDGALYCTHLPISENIMGDRQACWVRQMTNVIIYLNFGSAIMDAQPSGNTAEGLREYLQSQIDAGTPVQVLFKRKTPRIIQHTPQQLDLLRGTNNLWSDTGDTDLVYVADTKLYIDGKFNELNSAILSMGSNV